MRSGERMPESAVDRAYRLTREAILTGEYPPGFPLRVGEIAERSGVSSIPVREALRRLEAERFVESVANKGARVADLSFPDLADAYRLRILLEVEAVRLALPELAEEDLERARGLLEDMTRLWSEGRIEEGHEAHRRLHFLIYEKAGSTWLLNVISSIWDHTERYRRVALRWGAEPEELGPRHEQMLEALHGGDLDAVTTAVQQHFEEPMRAIENRARGS
ncbi:MAG TPA: GntR family transcriptional regulator [Actinomycetota bacterium]|nr:GntR family transcriptional regulator [Actinomycetota bacterium]